MTKQKFLAQLTKKFSLSKTLRFELIPVGKTLEFLKQNKIFEKDETIDKAYNQAKFYFDELHREFIKKALAPENVKTLKKNFDNFAKVFKKNLELIKRKKKDRSTRQKAQTAIKDARKNLCNLIAKLFVEEDKKWQREYLEKNNKKSNKKSENTQSKGVKFILSKEVISVLKEKFPRERNDEFVKNNWPSLFVEDKANPSGKVYIFDKFEKFTTYLGKFQQTRENLYKQDGTSTAVATRIVENFEKFLQNKQVFEKNYKNYVSQIKLNDYKEIFNPDYYLNCLLQEGIDEYNLNIGEINKKTKEYRDKNKIKKSQLPLFRPLDKQILGKVEKQRELIEPEKNKTEEQVFYEKFKEFIDKNERKFSKLKGLLQDLFNSEFKNEYQGIYLNRNAINTISRKWFADYEKFIKELPHQKDKEGGLKIKKFVSLLDVKNAIEKISDDNTQLFKDRYYKEYLKEEPRKEEKYFAVLNLEDKNYWQQFLTIWSKEFNSLFNLDREINKEKILAYNSSLKNAKKLKSFSKNNKNDIGVVKNYCDAALKIFQMSKYFLLSDKDRNNTPFELAQEFYAEYDNYYQDFDFIRYYNAFRNFITKKPYSEDKIKLNFDCGQLLGGWDKNKEKEKLGIIFREKGFYYLGIINKSKDKNIFDRKIHPEAFSNNSKWEKMEYKTLGDIKRQLPRIAFSNTANKYKEIFGYNQEIQNIQNEYDQFQKEKRENKDKWNQQFDKNKTTKLIAYYQRVLEKHPEKYKKNYELKWKNPKSYKSIGEFFEEIYKQTYKVKFVGINKEYLNKKVEKGEVYLFQIYNKDFSPNASGRKNLHTLFFLNLFSESNLKDSVLRLGGNAEVFFRKASAVKKVKKRGHSKKKIVELKRYTEDKILFHLPIEINFNAGRMKNKRFNQEINKLLARNSKDINIIGIDRGEKNLLYYTVINQNGDILEHGSLNEINGVNYFTKLIQREIERRKNRQSWQPIVKIKNLKQGYISYVIHKITELIEKYNAIVVLEDLNMRFKQIRSGIERTIYQQFEKALIDKLGYLVFKDNRDPNSPGGVLNGYQLTAPFVPFQNISKQTGILFYVNAEYTSKTDPLKGFRKNVYISNSASQKKIVDFIKKCKAIGWDSEEQSYFFTYNPADFNKKENSQEWTVFSKVPRIRREKNNQTGYWEAIPIDLNRKFEDLFKLWGFKDPKAANLKEVILEKEKMGELKGKKEFDRKERNFFQSFIYLFNLILQTRNVFSLQVKKVDNGKHLEIDGGVDFFASPVKPFFKTAAINRIYDEKGQIIKESLFKDINNKEIKENFAGFESKFITEESRKNLKNFDSDGVGAYNIARKGIMILEKIRENPDNPGLFIPQEEWDKFVLKQRHNP